MRAMTQRAVLLEALASTPTDIARLVRGLDETAAVWRGSGWSCRDVVAHLVAVEPLHLARWQRTVAEKAPALAALGADKALAALGADDTLAEAASPLSALTERFQQSRGLSLAWLREIGPADWQRPAIHERTGRTTLRFLVQDLVAHDIEHTAQLAAVLGEWRQARRPDASAPERGE
jgi:uncharacterized damage-inducible protein DinB